MRNLEEKQNLYKNREYYRNQFFMLGLELIVYFGAPAALGVFLGKKLDFHLGTGPLFLVICLVVAYIISWFIFSLRLRHIKRKLAESNEEISALEKDTN